MEPNNIIKLMNNISEESKNEKTENLIPILRQYNLNDLIRSIFCINSWIVNRSTINNCLALNNALTKINNFGNKNIKSYSEFVNFFNKIRDFLKPTVYDGIICDDFGEVKLAFNNKFYSIIIGTEYEHVFSVLQFLQRLSNLLGADELVETSLIYIDNIINQLAKYNISPYKEPCIRYEIPAENFFIAVNNLFSTNFYFSINPELVNIFSDTKVIKKHFILHNNINLSFI